MINKSKRDSKEEKPVNISILFNINPKEIVEQANKTVPLHHLNTIKCRKIRNHQTIKSHRETSLNNYSFMPFSITNKKQSQQNQSSRLDQNTDRQTFQKDQFKNIQENRPKRRIKRQSMDCLDDLKKKKFANQLFISCEQVKGTEKSLVNKQKLTPISSKKKSLRAKVAKPNLNVPTSTKSQIFKSSSNKIENSVLKNLMENKSKEKGKMSIQNLKKIISKLVSEEVNKQRQIKTKKSKQSLGNTQKTQRLRDQKKKKPKVNDNPKRDLRNDASKHKLKNIIQGVEDMVIKLSSFKSMNGSVLASQITQGECILKNQAINPQIRTSTSSGLLETLVKQNYSNVNVTQQQFNQKSEVERAVIKIQRFWREYRTKKLVKFYLSILNENIQQEYIYSELDNDRRQYLEKQKPNTKYQAQPIDQLFEASSEEMMHKKTDEDKREVNIPEKNSEMKQFHSFQLPKDQENNKVVQLKKKEISKWQETITFIQKNLNENNMKDVLMHVFKQMETNKHSLEKQINFAGTDKIDLASFTVALKSKQEQSEKEVESLQQIDKSMSELRSSYVYEEPNEELRMINFSNIHNVLNSRKKSLQERRQKELTLLQSQFQTGKLTEDIFLKQKYRLQLWIKNQQKEISKAKKNLDKGLLSIKSIMEKSQQDELLTSRLKNNSSLSRCLSDNYIKHMPLSKIKHLTGEKKDVMQEQGSDEEIDEEFQRQQLKQRLKNLKSDQKDSPQISYESLSKQYQQSYEEQQHNLIKNELELLASHQVIPGESKLKDLDPNDKEDIFEFVFLDLCIEFCQEVYCQPQKMKKVMQYIANKKKPALKKTKGIKTNINIVKEYLKRLLSFIYRTNKQTYNRVCIPMGPSALEMLKYMHFSQEDNEQEDDDLVGTLVLPTQLFESFQSNLLAGLEFEPYYEDDQKEQNRIEFLKGVIHIHNKAIFDALNESLDLERPFGIWGKPFPWKNVPQFNHELTQQQKEEKFKLSSDKVIEYCTYVCGIIIDKEESLVAPGIRLSQDYIDQIKQDRLSKMLANDLIQNQQRWVFYDDEQTEVMVELAYLIYEYTLKDAAQQMVRMRNRRQLELSFEMLE